MKKFICLAFTLIFTAICFGQNYNGILKAYNKELLYADDNGQWQTEANWKKKYGRKAFRSKFPDKTDYDHVQEQRFIRWDYEDAFTYLQNGEIIWSRVFISETPIDNLIQSACLILNNPIIEGNKIIGNLIEHAFVDYESGLFTTSFYVWSAKATYEFREGRYKVTLNNIKVRSTVEFSAGSYFRAHGVSTTHPLNYLLFENGQKRISFKPFINSIDHSFSNICFLPEAYVNNSDW